MKLKRSFNANETAASLLPALLGEYLEAGHKIASSKPSAKDLHKFRIATKKFRYTVELFLPIYGSKLDHELNPVREIQRVLGKLHDYHVIGNIVGEDHALHAKLQRSRKKKLKEFHQEWTAFHSKGQIKRWKKLLGETSAKPAPNHSKRKARIGSTEAARRAGTKFASTPTKRTPKATTP